MSFQNLQKAKGTTEKPPHSKDKSESQDESPEGEDSEEDEEREEEEEEEEDDEDEDDDDDEDEEDESDDDDEEEEENEDEGNESEDSDEGVASSRAHAASLDDVEKASVTGEKIPDIHISDNRDSRACTLSGDENCVEDLKTRTQQVAGASYAIPVTFDVEHDYVVSAVRVESKFSDDDESLGKESKWSTEPNNVSHTSLIGKPSTFPASSEEEINKEAEMDKGSPQKKSQISGDTVWMDSSDEVDSEKTGFGPHAGPADQTEEYGVEDNGSSDLRNNAGSHKWTRRSSQGSLSGQCSPGLPHYNKTAADAANDDSCWNSSSKSAGQNVHSPFLTNEEGSVVMANNPGEQQCLLDCCEVASLISIDRVSDEPSALAPPVPDKEDEPKKQIQDDHDIDSCGWLSKKETMDMGNDQIDAGSLDDEDNSCGSTVEGDVLKTPYVSGNSKHTELEEVAAVDVDDGSSEAGEQPTTDDITAFENCDSRRNDLLPQTDVDDVDLDSSDEAKSVVERPKEVRNMEGPITQVKQENVRYR